MKYQQIRIARLAEAGRKLHPDGKWHAFENVTETFYRVIGRLVQRVKLEAGESRDYLRLFDAVNPLPTGLLREGFRNEIVFHIDDDAYVLDETYTRVFEGWEHLAACAVAHGCTATPAGSNALAWKIRFETWSEERIHRALIVARGLTGAVSRCIDVPVLTASEAASILESEIRAVTDSVSKTRGRS